MGGAIKGYFLLAEVYTIPEREDMIESVPMDQSLPGRGSQIMPIRLVGKLI